jgi:hypothetical protein
VSLHLTQHAGGSRRGGGQRQLALLHYGGAGCTAGDLLHQVAEAGRPAARPDTRDREVSSRWIGDRSVQELLTWQE